MSPATVLAVLAVVSAIALAHRHPGKALLLLAAADLIAPAGFLHAYLIGVS